MTSYVAKIFSNGQQIVSQAGNDLNDLIAGVHVYLENEKSGTIAQIECCETGDIIETFRKTATE